MNIADLGQRKCTSNALQSPFKLFHILELPTSEVEAFRLDSFGPSACAVRAHDLARILEGMEGPRWADPPLPEPGEPAQNRRRTARSRGEKRPGRDPWNLKSTACVAW